MAFAQNKKRDRDRVRIAGWNEIDRSVFAELACPRSVFEGLQKKIVGKVVLKGDKDYNQDRKLSNPLFNEFPLAIVYCEVENDVAQALAVAGKCGLAISCRSGGHSTAGYSSNNGGMLLDTSRFNCVDVDHAAKTARVGPGCHFGKLNAVLDQYKLHVPGGGCPDVCPGGYMQGGGYGFTSREYGIHCDNVLEVRVMRADGQILTANATQNTPLYWGIRGGTGNNFGVLLETKYRLHPLWLVWGFSIAWPLDSAGGIRTAGAALKLMQDEYMLTATPRLGYMTFLVYQGEDPGGVDFKPYLIMRGLYDGPAAEGQNLVKRLSDSAGGLQYQAVDTYNNINHKLLFEPYEIPQFPETLPPPEEDKQARYVAKPLSLDHWTRMVGLYVNTPAPNKYSTMVIEPYGGAINKYPVDKSAFIHRDVLFDIFLDVFWWSDVERPSAESYLKTWTDFMEPFWNGHVYQNYPNRDLTNFAWNYWGNAYDKLRLAKTKYDPHNFFKFPQGIEPYSQDELNAVPEAQKQAIAFDEPIVAEHYSEPVEAA